MFAVLRFRHEPGFAYHGKFGFIGGPDYPVADFDSDADFLKAEVVAMHNTAEAASRDCVAREEHGCGCGCTATEGQIECGDHPSRPYSGDPCKCYEGGAR